MIKAVSKFVPASGGYGNLIALISDATADKLNDSLKSCCSLEIAKERTMI